MELDTGANDIWLLRHPVWVRWSGWVGIPIMFLGGIWILAIPIFKNNYEIILIASVLFLGGFTVYMCLQGFKVFPYLTADVEFDAIGFRINWPNGEKKKYVWSEVSKLNHYASAQVIEIKDNNDNVILAATEQATSYTKFVEVAVEKTGLKY